MVVAVHAVKTKTKVNIIACLSVSWRPTMGYVMAEMIMAGSTRSNIESQVCVEMKRAGEKYRRAATSRHNSRRSVMKAESALMAVKDTYTVSMKKKPARF